MLENHVFKVTLIGACHCDRTIRLSGATRLHRTNPVTSVITPGGVVANIARAMALEISSVPRLGEYIPNDSLPSLDFIGAAALNDAVLNVTALNVTALGDAAPNPSLAASGITARFAFIDAPPPSYTAILDTTGELVIGAADMALYDRVRPDDILPLVPKNPAAVVIDANFPASTLVALGASLAAECRLFAAGTSPEKIVRLVPLLTRLDGLVLNRAEAIALAGDDAVDSATLAVGLAAQLRDGGCVLISDGADNAVLAVGETVVTVKPPEITASSEIFVKNVNGAGDVMAGVFFCHWLDSDAQSLNTATKMTEILTTAVAAGASFVARKRSK
jgi:sugar/nucleoside kinase (ribokinase family)